MRHRDSHDSGSHRLPNDDAKGLRVRLTAAQEEQRAARAKLEEVDALIDSLARRRDDLLAVLAAAEVSEKSYADKLERVEASLPPLPQEDTPYQFKTVEISELDVTPEPEEPPAPPVEAPAPRKAAPPPVQVPAPRRAAPPPPPVQAPAPRKAAPPPVEAPAPRKAAPPPPDEAPAPRKAAPASSPAEAHGLSLEVTVGDDEPEVHALRGDRFVIGRGSKNDLDLHVAGVSRTHARVARDAEGTWVITDVSSGGGMLVNGRKCKESPLAIGDRILIADVELRVCAGGAAGRR